MTVAARLDAAFPASELSWKGWQYAAFRVALLYSAFWIIGLYVPLGGLLSPAIGALYTALRHTALPGSAQGEPLLNYLVMYAELAAALLLALLWSVLERRGSFTRRLFWPVHTLLRYYLASVLFIYGWDKVFLMQMPAPTLTDALTPSGELSQMGLLWRTVGASPLFQAVGGWAEVIPGGLLLFRRTTLPGALLSAVVMGFVFLLNLSFGVFVKIGSGHYFVFSLLLLTPYLGNLLRLLGNRPTQPLALPAAPPERWLRWAGQLLRVAALYPVAWLPLSMNLAFTAKWQPIPAASQLSGVYEVLSDSRPATQRLDMDRRWSRVALDSTTYTGKLPFFRVVRVNREVAYGRYTDDPDHQRLTLSSSAALMLDYRRQPDGTLLLTGREFGQPFTAQLRPAGREATRLLTEHFGWVIDLPDNR